QCKVTYSWFTGKVQLPIARINPGIDTDPPTAGVSTRQSSAICQTSAPFGRMVVQFVAERQSTYPIVPHPIFDPNAGTDSENVRLQSAVLEVESPDLDASGGS